MEADYLIVGFGLAGITLSYHLEDLGKKIIIIDGKKVKASLVAAGIYNPVVLNKFTLAWNSQEQIAYADTFYTSLGTYLGKEIRKKIPVLRKFNSAEEQNNWFRSIDKPNLEQFLSPKLQETPSLAIKGAYKFGEVKHTGRLLIDSIFDTYKKKLYSKDAFIEEEFNYKQLSVKENCIVYKNIKARRIVFCEGHQLKNNPLFKNLPLIGNKGTYIIIKSPNLKMQCALKSYYFLIPLGNDIYKFGATYGIHFKEENYYIDTKNELLKRFEALTQAPYEVIDHITGVRPTVIDRKPLVGKHNAYNSVFVLNGLGTRGVLMAPTISKHLLDFMEHKIALPKEIDIKRFVKNA